MIILIIFVSILVYEIIGLISYKLWNKVFKTEDISVKEFRFDVSLFFSAVPFTITLVVYGMNKFYSWLFKTLG